MDDRLRVLFRVFGCLLSVSACFLALSCRRHAQPQRKSYRHPKHSVVKEVEFPIHKLNRAKELLAEGKELYAQAVVAEDQEQKNILSKRALDYYFFPAQDILIMLGKQYPQRSYEIDRVAEELNRSIMDANKMIGTCD